MKTTIDISDNLLLRAKILAKENNVTLRSLIEKGLADLLEQTQELKPQKIKLRSFNGNGMNPNYEVMSWDEKQELIYGNGSHRH